jgi:hypothetical protein
MQYPDEPLPRIQMDLAQFVMKAQDLSQQEDPDEFARFLLAGRLNTDEGLKRVWVNARQNARAPPEGAYDLRRDFDSAIGITRDLPFTECMSVFPMASFDDTLKRDNHLKGTIPGRLVSMFIDLLLHGTYTTGRVRHRSRCLSTRSPTSALARLDVDTSQGSFSP